MKNFNIEALAIINQLLQVENLSDTVPYTLLENMQELKVGIESTMYDDANRKAGKGDLSKAFMNILKKSKKNFKFNPETPFCFAQTDNEERVYVTDTFMMARTKHKLEGFEIGTGKSKADMTNYSKMMDNQINSDGKMIADMPKLAELKNELKRVKAEAKVLNKKLNRCIYSLGETFYNLEFLINFLEVLGDNGMYMYNKNMLSGISEDGNTECILCEIKFNDDNFKAGYVGVVDVI